ncbi:conserved hypothetical protein [Flavobacterium sp. 9AF]|uniref:hypothetical protein n=1 Tax=Flavobacterium sp. 9AF TaxID=2653142 RepID=UPI0012EF08C1|nr:hypothetical protein [Flavobacterium sp. 9AF]VXB99255.1 conserved hypothetical protein [Flavobacterium sp. 9AF]
MKLRLHKLGLFLVLPILFSCKKEDVLLPLSDVSVMKTIEDHSPIYFFYEVNDTDTLANINTKNSISTTNWIFNIDKRLTLDLIIPEIKLLQHKKKNSSHTNEAAINVFSYSDSITKSLAFLPFTDVQYKFDKDFSKFFIKEHSDLYFNYFNLTINFNKENKITVDGNEVERAEFIAFIKDFTDFMSEGKATIIHLNFDKRLTYGEYIQNKTLAWQLTSEKIQLSSYEFIYDEEKLPECGCKL